MNTMSMSKKYQLYILANLVQYHYAIRLCQEKTYSNVSAQNYREALSPHAIILIQSHAFQFELVGAMLSAILDLPNVHSACCKAL